MKKLHSFGPDLKQFIFEEARWKPSQGAVHFVHSSHSSYLCVLVSYAVNKESSVVIEICKTLRLHWVLFCQPFTESFNVYQSASSNESLEVCGWHSLLHKLRSTGNRSRCSTSAHCKPMLAPTFSSLIRQHRQKRVQLQTTHSRMYKNAISIRI